MPDGIDRNREDIKALTEDVKAVNKDVKAVTESVRELTANMTNAMHEININMAGLADYKQDKAKLEARIDEVRTANNENAKEISVLIEKNKVHKENIAVIRKEQKQAVGIVVSLLLAIIGKLLYPYFGA